MYVYRRRMCKTHHTAIVMQKTYFGTELKSPIISCCDRTTGYGSTPRPNFLETRLTVFTFRGFRYYFSTSPNLTKQLA